MKIILVIYLLLSQHCLGQVICAESFAMTVKFKICIKDSSEAQISFVKDSKINIWVINDSVNDCSVDSNGKAHITLFRSLKDVIFNPVFIGVDNIYPLRDSVFLSMKFKRKLTSIAVSFYLFDFALERPIYINQNLLMDKSRQYHLYLDF